MRQNTISIQRTSDRRNVEGTRPVLVSRAEIAKRHRITAMTLASFAVDNIPVNPDTQHIFQDFVDGRIATNEEVDELLHAHYSKIAFG